MKYSKYIKVFDSNFKKDFDEISPFIFTEVIGILSGGLLLLSDGKILSFTCILGFILFCFGVICWLMYIDDFIDSDIYLPGYFLAAMVLYFGLVDDSIRVLGFILTGIGIASLCIYILLAFISYPFRYMKFRRMIKEGKCIDGRYDVGTILGFRFCREETDIHDMDGCKCRKCEAIRRNRISEDGHDWDGCICLKCGQQRNCHHDWDGDVCLKCGYIDIDLSEEYDEDD